MKRIMAALLALMLLCSTALAEEELSLFDLVEWDDEVTYDDVTWDFPVDLMDMEPQLVVLANKHMLLPKDFYAAPLVTMKSRKADKKGVNTNGGVRKVSGEMKLQADCAEALVRMFEAAIEDGYKLYLKSAYRSWSTQNTMYSNRLKKNKGKDDGWVSKPGASDHQTGLGCDILNYEWTQKSGMNEKFAKTAEAQWMAAHCHEFGFILRYPEDKEEITEINFEPWHFRYVGVPAATYILEHGLCLEEFCEQLNAAIARFLSDGGDPALVKPFMQVSAEY